MTSEKPAPAIRFGRRPARLSSVAPKPSNSLSGVRAMRISALWGRPKSAMWSSPPGRSTRQASLRASTFVSCAKWWKTKLETTRSKVESVRKPVCVTEFEPHRGAGPPGFSPRDSQDLRVWIDTHYVGAQASLLDKEDQCAGARAHV